MKGDFEAVSLISDSWSQCYTITSGDCSIGSVRLHKLRLIFTQQTSTGSSLSGEGGLKIGQHTVAI